MGLHESIRCGVTTLGDIAQSGWAVRGNRGGIA